MESRSPALNDFQVSGVNCQYAMLSATDYTDSALAIPNAGSTNPVSFEAGGYPRLYHWRCRETSTTGPHEYTYYHCHADGRPDGYHGTAYMSFKWWLGPTRSCPTFPVDEAQEWLAASTWATRNQVCSSAEEWIRTADQSIHRFGQAYAITSGHSAASTITITTAVMELTKVTNRATVIRSFAAPNIRPNYRAKLGNARSKPRWSPVHLGGVRSQHLTDDPI